MPCSHAGKNPFDDAQLVQIVDQAVAEAARKSGEWLLCRPGCSDCCIGVFPISQLDVLRLRRGIAELHAGDPQKAERIRLRARESVARLADDFPGDPLTGILRGLADDWGNDEPCPALSPEDGTCGLYEHRPMTCRVFGPPLRTGPEGDIGICELCYHGAAPQQIAACEVVPDPDHLEEALIEEAEETSGVTGETIVAYALL
jgi:Fe-S-cluster containining protein